MIVKVTNDWDDEVEYFTTAAKALESLDLTVEEYIQDILSGTTHDFKLEVLL